MTIIDSTIVGKPESLVRVNDSIINKLNETYNRYQKEQETNLNASIGDTDKFVNELIKKHKSSDDESKDKQLN